MEIGEEAKLWIEVAYEVLYDVELAVKNKRWFRAAFYAQQAVEKALKALHIVHLREPLPYT